MLIQAFYNLAEKNPKVKAEPKCKGFGLRFTDGAGDDLEIILSRKGIADVVKALGGFEPRKRA